MEPALERRDDALTFQRLRHLLAGVDGCHSVHCEADGSVVLMIYLPAIEAEAARQPAGLE
jgi:hypothetical protein